MSLLRIRVSLADEPVHCQWVLVNDNREPVTGAGPLTGLPHHVEQIQLVLPAAEVLITSVNLPQTARRDAGSVLAYALEDELAGEPDANQVSWIGSAGDKAVLAVADKSGLTRWRDALAAVGIQNYEVHCETLLLPRAAGEWSLAWNGSDGFIRTGEAEGGATGCGEYDAPPLSLRLLLEEAKIRNDLPGSIALFVTAPGAVPDIEVWTAELGVSVRLAGDWGWDAAQAGAGLSLVQPRRRWRMAPGIGGRLRPAIWMVAAALTLHAAALAVDWSSLAYQRQDLRRQMESRFRTVFPDAVAVVDPALQMRRKLAEARHAGGQTDSSDFLPMIEQVAVSTRQLGGGTLRKLSYEGGRMTLEFAGVDEESVQDIVTQLRRSGLGVDLPPASTPAAGAAVVLTVRAL